MSPVLVGFSLILVASVAGGVFAAPLRRRRIFSVELMWMIVFLLGYLLIPHGIVTLLLPGWEAALRQVGLAGLAPAILFGLGWGVASLLFAHGVAMMGVSLGFAIMMGLIIAVGSLLPLLRHWDGLSADTTIAAMAGIALCLAGVALCGRAGVLRDQGGTQAQARQFGLGLTVCVLSGVLSACANLGFEFAAPVAQAFGPEVHPVMASVARWLPVYWGGSCMVAAYSIVRISLRREWGLLAAPGAGRDLGWAVAAAVLLPLGQLPYGMGAHLLGSLGTSVGFAVSTGGMLLVANLMGIWLGEWREAPAAARRWLWGGLATLMIAMLVLAARAG